ncbi:MAG: hypothetical protein L3J74_02555 [Bacteroidales bacterium]|nr:hypothetical protein [Bacteroidales bacterium]
MRRSILTIAGILVATTSLFASADAEKIFDNKCAVCHIKTIPTDRSSMVGPALFGVMKHVKMAYPNREDAVDFMVDYVQNPSKEKAICMPQKIAYFGLMPSQKGLITPKELKKVSEWMFDNYPPENFRGRGGMGCAQSCSTFVDFDLNKDGVIVKAELLSVRADKQAKRAAQGFPMRNAANAPAFKTIDADGDGKVTQKEFTDFQINRKSSRMNSNIPLILGCLKEINDIKLSI